jgi:hypothetical protein
MSVARRPSLNQKVSPDRFHLAGVFVSMPVMAGNRLVMVNAFR